MSNLFRLLHFFSAHALDTAGAAVTAPSFAPAVHVKGNSFSTFSVDLKSPIMYIMLNNYKAIAVLRIRHAIMFHEVIQITLRRQ